MFKLNTVTYGTKPASFLAVRTFTKTIDLAWDLASDQLRFSFSVLHSALTPHMQSVDSLGLVGPVITRTKIFL